MCYGYLAKLTDLNEDTILRRLVRIVLLHGTLSPLRVQSLVKGDVVFWRQPLPKLFVECLEKLPHRYESIMFPVLLALVVIIEADMCQQKFKS